MAVVNAGLATRNGEIGGISVLRPPAEGSEDEALRKKLGNISEIVGRAMRGGELQYEVMRWGRENEGAMWEPLGSIKRKEPYVLKMCLNYDAKLQAATALSVTCAALRKFPEAFAAYDRSEEHTSELQSP